MRNLTRSNHLGATRRRGRPTAYRESYCERLEDFLARGQTVNGFAAEIGVHRDTIYAWAKTHADFAAAKGRGEGRRETYLIEIGLALALGTMTYLKAEEPITHNGVPVLDSEGNPLIKRTYAQARGSAAAWIFLCKNMLGWRDHPQTATFRGNEARSLMTREMRLAEIGRLQKIRHMAQRTCDGPKTVRGVIAGV